jgi:transketolase
MITHAKSGHPGGSLSAVEILVTLFFESGRRRTRGRFVGIQDTYAESGTPEELMQKYGLVASNIVTAAKRVLGRK